MWGVMWVIVLLVDLTIVVSWGEGGTRKQDLTLECRCTDLGLEIIPALICLGTFYLRFQSNIFDYSQYLLYESNHAALTLTFIHCCGDLDMHSLQTFPHKSQHYYISKNSIIGLKLQLFSTYKESNMATVTLTLTKETPYFCEENTYLPFQCRPNLILIHHGILILFVE